jgi:DNA-binding NtrC family response regulator
MSDTGGLVYVVDDDVSVREGVASLIRSAGLETKALASGQEFLALQRPEIPSCLVLDVQLPGLSGLDVQQELVRSEANLPIIFLTGYGDIPMTVRAIRAGAADFLTKPFEKEELLSAIRRCFGRYHKFNRQPRDQFNDKLTQEKLYLEDERYGTATDIEDRKRAEEEIRKENIALREEIIKTSIFEEIVGNSPALQQVLNRVSKVAATDSTVLITGETGTGKELIARAIHKASKRSGRAFVSVNCAAIPPSLIPSELFGHEKGSFTGATQRRLGRFELAEGGTIFLDEVGELPAETQVALLRVLQEHEFERVGGNRSIKTNVRVIVATNRDLPAAIAAGTFREDLFYRLNVFPIEIPPLRKRREDIPLLVEYFIARYAREAGKNVRNISKETLDLFQSYPWPGNVRELQNVIERSVIVCETETFSVDESWLSRQSPTPPTSHFELRQRVADEEREAIEEALTESRGRVFGASGAAAKLGIARSTLELKIRTLKIDKNRFKASNPS